jgi:hypothetical protein
VNTTLAAHNRSPHGLESSLQRRGDAEPPEFQTGSARLDLRHQIALKFWECDTLPSKERSHTLLQCGGCRPGERSQLRPLAYLQRQHGEPLRRSGPSSWADPYKETRRTRRRIGALPL